VSSLVRPKRGTEEVLFSRADVDYWHFSDFPARTELNIWVPRASVPIARRILLTELTVGLLASSLDAVSPEQLGAKAGKLTATSSLPVLVPAHWLDDPQPSRPLASSCGELPANLPPARRLQRGDRGRPFLPGVSCGLPS
jgi:hypothetical protein